MPTVHGCHYAFHKFPFFLMSPCVDVFPLHAELVARGQYSEGPATGQLDTGFSWFPRVFKQIL
jgi:hypothetical protein